jgi:hypothetical protein
MKIIQIPRLISLNAILLLLFTIVSLSCGKDTANRNPEISSVGLNPVEVFSGGTAKVAVTASDPDKDQLTYNYTVSRGHIEGLGKIAFWTTAATPGTDTVHITVTDGNGGQTSAIGSVYVTGATTLITGGIRLADNISGNLLYSKVSIYTDYGSWMHNLPANSITVGDEGSKVVFNMVGILPGNYILDVWKDVDNNGKWSYGDYVGWYGSGSLANPSFGPIQIANGQTIVCDVTNMQLVSY